MEEKVNSFQTDDSLKKHNNLTKTYEEEKLKE